MAPDDLIRQLDHHDPAERFSAAERLGRVPPTPAVVAALIRALADPSFHEWPGDYDAPPFRYAVADAAQRSLEPAAPSAVTELLAAARRSPLAARHAAHLFRRCGEAGVAPLVELAHHADPEVRRQVAFAIRPLHATLADGPARKALVRALLQALADDSSSVTCVAVDEAEYLVRDNPELYLGALAPPELVAALVDRVRDRPQAKTFARALALVAGPAAP